MAFKTVSPQSNVPLTAFSAVFVLAAPGPATAHAPELPAPIISVTALSSGATLSTKAASWGRLRARLAAWAELPADWDGDDGEAPTSSAIAGAGSFLRELERRGAPLPRPFIAGDGEIGFRWSKGDAFASVAFTRGQVLGSVRTPDGKVERINRKVSSAGPLLSGLASSLTKFA